MLPIEDPAISFVAITITALIYSAFSNIALKKWGDRKRVKVIQDEMTKINKLAMAAAKTEDPAKKKEADEQQGRITGLLKESMILQFKPLVITLPLFFGVSWALRQAFPKFEMKLSIALPIFIQNFERFPNWRDTFGVFGWFILAAILGGLLMQFIVGKLEERSLRAEKEKKNK